MTLINLAESWLPYPQFERLFFSDTENAVVINGKEKKKSLQNKKTVFTSKKTRRITRNTRSSKLLEETGFSFSFFN